MAIEIVSFPIKHGDFPVRYLNVYQRVYRIIMDSHGIREYQDVFGRIPMKSLVISSMASWKLPELGGRLENHLLLGDFRASHGADFPLRAIFRLAVKI